MRRIAVYSQKGGCGKTTLSFNLAFELARAGRKILAIDCDPQANLSSVTIQKPGNTLANVLVKEDNIAGIPSVSAAEAIYQTPWDNLFVLPADRGLAAAAHIAVSCPGGDRRLRQVLAPVVDFDFILLDSAPTNSLLTLAVLACADSVYVPVTANCWDVEAVGKTQTTIREIAADMEVSVQLDGIILNRWTRNKVAKNIAADMEKLFGERLLGTIPDGVKLSEANFRKLPISLYAPESPIADSFKTIARKLLWQQQKAA